MSVKYFLEQAESKITNSPNPEPKNDEIFKKKLNEAGPVQNYCLTTQTLLAQLKTEK